MNPSQFPQPDKFFLIAGPCVVESRELVMETADYISKLCQQLNIDYIFKASYRKANRSRLDSFTGIGDSEAMTILGDVREKYSIPVLTDIHNDYEAAPAAEVADVLQIPAFLCRQTGLLQAAGRTGRIVNIKKGQFLSGESMKFAVEKVQQTGNHQVWLTERGSMFGYNDLVVDYRNIPTMKQIGVPVIMDVTHSLQQPNQSNGVTGGKPELIRLIASAAIASGADGVFIETHPEPAKALSDGANMLPLNELDDLLIRLKRIKEAVI
jgi:2-dehydro-3-deoxyphosphooctonate aldolase (KDO 8-P synthase)